MNKQDEIMQFNISMPSKGESGIIKIFLILISLFFFYLSLSCNHSVEPIVEVKSLIDTAKIDSVHGELSNGILPLRVGYYWRYKSYYLNRDSSISYLDIEDEYSIVKSLSVKLEDKSYLAFHQGWGYFDPEIQTYRFRSDEWYFRNFDDGLYLMGSKYHQDSIYTKLLAYKYPVKKGDSWQSPHLVYLPDQQTYSIYDTVSYTCTETNAIFTTPIGSFSCIVYFHREKSYGAFELEAERNVFEYYAKGIGLVGAIYSNYFETDKAETYPRYMRILVSTNVISK